MRLMRRGLLAAGLTLALALASQAQSADKILAEHIKALGGAKALKALPGFRLRGEARDPATGQIGTFTLQTKSPDRFYLEVSGNGSGWSEAFNGRSAWRKDSSGGLQTLTGAEAAQLKASAYYWNDHFLSYKSRKMRVQLLGREMLDARPVFVVELIDRAGTQRRFFFDAANYLLLKEQESGSGAAMEMFFRDYRAVDGVQEPHRIVLRRGSQTLETTARELSHPENLADTAFDYPSASRAALPDPAALLEQVRQNQKKLDDIRYNYTCRLTETETELDSRGHLQDKAVNEYELFFLGREPLLKHISENGKPLSEKEQGKEDERVSKAFRAYQIKLQKGDADARAGKEDSEKGHYTVGIRDFLKAARFSNPRRERFRGREVVVFDFDPKPDHKAQTWGESFVQKLVGVVWIDDQAQQVARVEARTNATIRFAGGVLASLDPGAAFIAEQEMVNNEVWLPVYQEVHLSGRMLLFKGVKYNGIQRYSEYKKFSVEMKLSAPPGHPPPL